MLKLFRMSHEHTEEDPEITFLDLDSYKDGLTKKAAHSEIIAFIEKLTPKEGYTYLHINAMTAGEYHGANRNHDYFPEDNLKAHFKTFETSPAHVFRSHINKDPNKAYGKVIFAVYNDYMHRVELIAECPNELVEDINARIQKGEFPSTSMACRTPWDTCSICGHKAKSRQEYCSHLSRELGKLYPDGRKTFAINDAPLHFFDISIVIRPADVNSSILQKVAENGNVIGSAELAEIEGLTEKQADEKKAELKKWSAFIKEISDGTVMASEEDPTNILDKTLDLPLHTIHNLHLFDLNQVFKAFADLGISPSIEYLAELIARKHLGEGFEGIGVLVEEMISKVDDSSIVPVQRYEEPSEVNPSIYSILSPHVVGSSLLPEMVEKRSSEIGYMGLGPQIEPNHTDTLQVSPQDIHSVNTLTKNYGKVLVGLGVAALLAKYFITSQIEKKINTAGNEASKNNVKIVLIKNASDFRVAANLSRTSLYRSTPKSVNQDSNSGTSDVAFTNKVIKRLLKRTKNSVGNKLAGILRLVGLGVKVSDNFL